MPSSVTLPIGAAATRPQAAAGRYYRRFGLFERVLHAGLMFSFIGCALSGLPLLFPYTDWAKTVATLMGGFQGAGLVHRVCATVMCTVFVSHIVQFLWRGLAAGTLLSVLWGPNSLVPQPKDVVDLYQHMKFFIGLGPRPQFDRYTYWEKFDYMAVFWGMFIIGGSGLMLWFAIPLSSIVPGWIFNIATLVHGEEALLAVGFIFVFHFFHNHFRPDKFPMDVTIFTGRVPLERFKEERPAQYQRAVDEGKLESMIVGPPSRLVVIASTLFGASAIILGVALIISVFITIVASHI
jgi:cytochrome b subunit of formate dehydrogenase